MDLRNEFGFTLSKKLQKLEISSEKILNHYLDKIEQINPTVNAIVSLEKRKKLITISRKIDQLRATGKPLHPFAGLPIAIKDLEDTKGILSTQGSKLYSNYIPKTDSPMVTNIRKAGLIIIGKTNTPEFGIGGQTFNSIFGTTVNPLDTNKTSGGSSGGAAAAVQSRLLPFADGSDMMGSLRTPCSFCNTYGFRPTPGLIPFKPSHKEELPQISTNGAIARHPIDLSILIEIFSGKPMGALLGTSDEANSVSKKVIGIPSDYLKNIKFENGIIKVFNNFIDKLKDLGFTIVELDLKIDQNILWKCWTVLRSKIISLNLTEEYEKSKEILKNTLVWEIEEGNKISDQQLELAKITRSNITRRINNVFSKVDFLLLPSAQVFPFSKDKEYPQMIENQTMDTYHRWLEINILASLLGLPVVSVPGNELEVNLPLGIQFIAKSHDDSELLQTVLQIYNKSS